MFISKRKLEELEFRIAELEIETLGSLAALESEVAKLNNILKSRGIWK